jgi:hypothetical protein
MRHTATLLAATLLLAGTATGCSKSGDDIARDCAVALTDRTGGDRADTPTVSEAQERVDAFDDTLAGMVRSGYQGPAKDAADALQEKFEGGGKKRPEACESLSDDDYTVLLMAKGIDGLGWTDEDGKFDKLKMADGVLKN